jgi:hypothetical protein
MTGRQWAIGGCMVLLVGAVGLTVVAASCAVMVKQQVEVREGQQSDTFERESKAILARLGDVPALIEDTPTGPRLSPGNLERRKVLAANKRPKALWVLVWAEDEKKIVRLSLPFWLLRMSPKGIDIDVNDVDLGKLRLSVDDLERAGPGPLLIRDDRNSRVLVWTE